MQVPDVSWNQPFKEAISRFYEEWMARDTDKEVTRGGNPWSPPIKMYLLWVVDTWESLSFGLTRDLFKSCGIATSLDGSDGNLEHCFKPHGLIPDSLAVLQVRSVGNIVPPVIVPEDDHDEQ